MNKEQNMARQGAIGASEMAGSTYDPNQWKTQPNKEGGVKHDSLKNPMDLLPMLPLGHVSRVLGFGARKYGPHNWRNGLEYRRLLGATLRHVAAFQDGEDLDEETKLSHIDHAICELLFLSQFIHEGRKELDDRYVPPGPKDHRKPIMAETS